MSVILIKRLQRHEITLLVGSNSINVFQPIKELAWRKNYSNAKNHDALMKKIIIINMYSIRSCTPKPERVPLACKVEWQLLPFSGVVTEGFKDGINIISLLVKVLH